ncbi:target of rapamycin complex 2 subunit MAPKAP1-like [Oppia nitens]|uniref:target of rapamycin complex 2 subunit MAPKAP1-like n=1 Tax=Oppia nitens TaxID=1686743 RepID=UPI0023D9BAE8|nr:target of rapamycin complex 2 subunit MAPKAP1-like [Oppia nitens]XP_054157989.1 target of rapamycin complex 2 subunit MAPKAP1-like [Oppia nitens]
MAFYDDKSFILSHIRHSFITCDDTGMCEMVMLNESIRNQYDDNDVEDMDLLKTIELETKSELLEAAQSYDIMSDMELIGVRRRSNTAQRLEKLKLEKKSQSKVKTIQWKTSPYSLTDYEINELFPKKELKADDNDVKLIEQQTKDTPKPLKKKSALSLQLENCPNIPNNPFLEYARFDGRVSEGTPTKRITIYLTMLAGEQRQHPMEVVIQINARVGDLIGLICWQYTNEAKEPRLKPNVANYSLRIAEENGEVDPDFPSLNAKEFMAKFGFPVLALVEKDEHENNILVTIYIDEVFSKIQVNSLQLTLQELLELTIKKRRPSLVKGVSYKLEKRNEPGVALDLKQTLSDCNTLEFVLVPDQPLVEVNDSRPTNRYDLDMTAMEAPLYKSYTVTAINKYGRTAEVELGISGDKIEVTPMANKGFFQWQPKAVTVNDEDVILCELLAHKLNTGKSTFKVVYWNGIDYKHWTFEAETSITNEILKKLHFVMKMKSSHIRDEYFVLKEHKNLKKYNF